MDFIFYILYDTYCCNEVQLQLLFRSIVLYCTVQFVTNIYNTTTVVTNANENNGNGYNIHKVRQILTHSKTGNHFDGPIIQRRQ